MANQTAALSVDVDDLVLAYCDFSGLPYRHQRPSIRREMARLMELLDHHGVRGTLFVPGYILEAVPDVLEHALDRGHEIACHGDRHVAVYRHSPDEFEEDLGIAVERIRRATGITPLGYRAPGMTLVHSAGWAAPILKRHGFLYSSSVPGVAVGQHKFLNAPSRPFLWPCGLVELPVSIQRLWGVRVPVCGSVYTRLLPRPLVRHATERFRRESPHPLFYYFHPFEVFPDDLPREIVRRHWRLRLYTAGCRRFRREFERLLPRFSWMPYAEALTARVLSVANP